MAAQAGLCLAWSEIPEDTFCRVVAQMKLGSKQSFLNTSSIYSVHMSLVMRKSVSDQVRLKPACSATEASMRFEILVTETRDITLSRQRTTKALIRLRGCAGWSAPLLFAYDIRHVFRWPGSYNIARKYAIQWYIHINTGDNLKFCSNATSGLSHGSSNSENVHVGVYSYVLVY